MSSAGPFKHVSVVNSVDSDQTDWVYTVCLYVEISPWRKHLHAADDFSRRHFQMHFTRSTRFRLVDTSVFYILGRSISFLGSKTLRFAFDKLTIGRIGLFHIVVRHFGIPLEIEKAD